MKSESLVWQTDENDCGVACAASLLALHGVEVDYHSFRETFHIGSSGISFQQIHDRLTAYGAAPETYQVEDSEDIDDSMLPCIASFERHFVLILGVRRGRIKIFDPTFGKLELPHRKFQERYTGYVMKIAGFPELKSEKLQNPTIERNAGLEHELFRKNALLIGGGAILISSVNLSVPYLVDQILSSGPIPMIFRLALTLFTIKICLHFLTLFSKILVMRLEFRLVPVLIERYLSAFERMPFFSFSSRSLGDYLSRFHDMTEAGNLFNSIFNGFLMNLIVFIMSLGALFWVRPMIAFYILASSALLIVLYRAFMPGLRAVRYSFDLESNRLNTRFSDLIGSFELLSSKSLKDFFRHSILKDQVGRQVRINRELRQRTMLFDLVLDFFTLSYSFEVILIVMFLFGRFESVSESITISFYFASILGPMIHLLSTFSEFMEFRLKARRIDNILALNPARYEFCEQDDTRTPLVRIIEAGLGVGGKVLFHSVNLDIYSGAKIALMGRSGIGKTSLLRILTGMVHHTSGRVVFSKALSEGDRVSNVLYVPQHTQLTRGTLREFFSPEIEGFGADFFVKFKRLFGPELRSGSTEELLDLQVSPSGGMSRGQIQRAVILKSLFDPSPLKLYDEPTANLDPESTQSVLELVFRDSAAVVLVSHDQRVYLKGVTRFEVTSDGLFPRA